VTISIPENGETQAFSEEFAARPGCQPDVKMRKYVPLSPYTFPVREARGQAALDKEIPKN
jgi:hypothetical protein